MSGDKNINNFLVDRKKILSPTSYKSWLKETTHQGQHFSP